MLTDNSQFRSMFGVIWGAQIEIVGLYPKSPRNYMRGELRRRCLGLREPKWVVSNNGAVAAKNLRDSGDLRVIALNKANGIDFDAVIAFHVEAAVDTLGSPAAIAALKARLPDDQHLLLQQTLIVNEISDNESMVVSGDPRQNDATSAASIPQALTEIVNDDKKLKSQRLTNVLKSAAADCWQRSTSGRMAGANLSDQVLNASNWRRLYWDDSDGNVKSS